MLFVMATILMVQLQSFQRLFLVVAVAPLGLIGVVAYAMMGGIIAGTAITLLFLPALYLTWFRIKEPKERGKAKGGILPESGAA